MNVFKEFFTFQTEILLILESLTGKKICHQTYKEIIQMSNIVLFFVFNLLSTALPEDTAK
jgi:hypothetical protein